jgi:hypothetical protein
LIFAAGNLMTKVQRSITNAGAVATPRVRARLFGIAVQVLGGWSSEREVNAAATPERQNLQDADVDEGPDEEFEGRARSLPFFFAFASLG